MGVASSRNNDFSIELSNQQMNAMKRQIALTTLKFENDQAIKKAQEKEAFAWQFLGCGTSVISIILYSQLTKNRVYSIPIVPLVMYVGYRYDQTSRDTGETIKKEAEKLLHTQQNLFTPIGGPITLEELDKRRMMWKQQKANNDSKQV